MSFSGRMMSGAEVVEQNIVIGSKEKNHKPTTVDATIGRIITKAGDKTANGHTIPPRGIAWIISNERFALPNNVTGITTLRTTWTRQGILTLTVGIVDPGYDGQLSTAVINFGKNDFMLAKGDPFFRTVFFQHDEVIGTDRKESPEDYAASVRADIAAFSDTFLTVDTLAEELSRKIFQMPKWVFNLAVAGLFLALLSLILPPAWGLWQEVLSKQEKLHFLEQKIDALESDLDLVLKAEKAKGIDGATRN